MQAKCKKVSINHLNRRTKESIRMLSNRKEKESMMEKLDCNIELTLCMDVSFTVFV